MAKRRGTLKADSSGQFYRQLGLEMRPETWSASLS
jgi:hypothetical protein